MTSNWCCSSFSSTVKQDKFSFSSTVKQEEFTQLIKKGVYSPVWEACASLLLGRHDHIKNGAWCQTRSCVTQIWGGESHTSMHKALVCFVHGLMRRQKFGHMSVDTKSVQPQFEVYQDLGIWVFASSPYLARRSIKSQPAKKMMRWVFGTWKL